ncbi:MAG: alanine racemase [Pseudomonadota bacterium]
MTDLLSAHSLPASTPRPTRVDVDLDALTHNYRQLRQHANTPVMAVLKANAYGHGIGIVARHLATEPSISFGVAYLEEALLIRALGIRSPVLVFGGVVSAQVPDFLHHNIQLAASSVEKLQHIDHVAGELGITAEVHLKIDTGMERIGTHYYNVDPLFEQAVKASNCRVVGVYSHFANADDEDLRYTDLQLERFEVCVAKLADKLGYQPMRHIANSAGTLALPAAHLDMVRCGQALYGAVPAPHLDQVVPLQPTMNWHSKVTFFKVVKANHPVSYGSTWQSDRNTRVVTVPVGYADGYPRSLSNSGHVVIRGKRYPIVGRVCMDQIMVNIGDGEAWNGDTVTLIGDDMTVGEVANFANTIAHDILSGISARVPRRYFKDGKELVQ